MVTNKLFKTAALFTLTLGSLFGLKENIKAEAAFETNIITDNFNVTSNTTVTGNEGILSYKTSDKYAFKAKTPLIRTTKYEMTVVYSHSGTEETANNEAMYISATNDANGYGVDLKVRGDTVVSCLKDNNAAFDIRNYWVVKNSDETYIAKIYFWVGNEDDWYVRFGATSTNLACNIHDYKLTAPGETDDNAIYPQTIKDNGIIHDDAENQLSLEKPFTPGAYTNGAPNDGRVTNDSSLAIDGNYSYYATSSTVNDWGGFITSIKTLDAGKVYTVTFDFNISNTERWEMWVGNTSVSGAHYRAFYFNNNTILDVHAGIKDHEIGNSTWTGFHDYDTDDWGAPTLSSSYIIQKDGYRHAKFTFVSPCNGTNIQFIDPDNEGANPSSIVLDNINVFEGNADLEVKQKVENEEILPPAKLLFTSTFDQSDSSSSYNLKGGAHFDEEQFIAGTNGIHATSEGGWKDFIFLNEELKPSTTYTIYFKYRILSVSEGSFAYVNLRSASNVDTASYFGFNLNGAYRNFSNQVIMASINSSNEYYSELKLEITTKEANDINFVIGASGSIDVLFDDLAIYEGIGGEPVTETNINTHFEIVAQENFENGYGIFDGEGIGVVTGGTNVINGNESAILDSNEGGIIVSTGNQFALESAMTYTMMFRASIKGENTILRVKISNGEPGNSEIVLGVNASGKLVNKKGIDSVSINTTDRYYEISAIFSTPSNGDVTIAFTGNNGIIAIDDILLAKGKAKLSYDSPALKEENGITYNREEITGNTPRASIDGNLTGLFDYLQILFSEKVGLVQCYNLSDAVKILDGENALELDLRFDYFNKRVVIENLNSTLTENKEYTITIEGFENGNGVAIEKVTKTFIYKAVVEPGPGDDDPTTSVPPSISTPSGTTSSSNDIVDDDKTRCSSCGNASNNIIVISLITILVFVIFNKKHSV